MKIYHYLISLLIVLALSACGKSHKHIAPNSDFNSSQDSLSSTNSGTKLAENSETSLDESSDKNSIISSTKKSSSSSEEIIKKDNNHEKKRPINKKN